jgi:iron(III) transport system permease protein
VTRRWLPGALLGGLLAYLVVLPLGLLLVSSVKPSGFALDEGWTLKHYGAVYLDPGFYRLLANTLVFAFGSLALALTLGLVLAWLVERSDMPARGLVRGLVILPMATPPILLAIGWVMLLSPRTGVLNDALRAAFGLAAAPFDIFTFPGMIFVEGLSLVPSTFLILAPALRNMDPSLEEAALTSGSGVGFMLRRVLLPLLLPAILSAAVFLLIVGFVVFDIPATIGMPNRIFVLSSRIYYLANDAPGGLPDYGRISAMTLLLLVLLVALALAYQRLTRQAGRFATVTGKGFRPRPFRLGAWRWPALAGVAVYFVLAVVAPFAVLLWTSLLPYQARATAEALKLVSLANHAELFANPRLLLAVQNSAVAALVAATVVAALSALISWVVIRTKSPGRRWLDTLAFLPIAIPGVMISVGLIYVYLTLKFVPVYGTIWIICIAYITIYLSYGTRVTNGTMLQLHRDLEDAARLSGASWGRTMRRIVVPLLMPALVAIWIWVVAHCLRELTAALMLQSKSNVTVPALLFDYWSGGEPNKAAAVGVWLMVVLVGIVALWQIAGRRGRAP